METYEKGKKDDESSLDAQGTACEITRTLAHMRGDFDEGKIEAQEKRKFGRTLTDMIREGYKNKVVLKDKNGDGWCLHGKLKDLGVDLDQLQRLQDLRSRFTDSSPLEKEIYMRHSQQSPVVGPVVILPLEREQVQIIDPTQEGGCGHTQFALIGPSILKVLEEIARNSRIRDVLQCKGNCLVCGKPLRSVMIFIAGEQNLDELNKLASELGPVVSMIIFIPEDSYGGEFPGFTEQEIQMAKNKVICH